jgi:hypothetical protein
MMVLHEIAYRSVRRFLLLEDEARKRMVTLRLRFAEEKRKGKERNRERERVCVSNEARKQLFSESSAIDSMRDCDERLLSVFFCSVTIEFFELMEMQMISISLHNMTTHLIHAR